MIRKATIKDVRAMNHLRLQVRENVLSDPALVTSETTAHAITAEGRGWVYEEAGEILGFAIAKDEDPTIWALFVHPHHEGLGIGHQLHSAAVAWLWSRGAERIWLGTDPGTRAERFYLERGWRKAGIRDNGELLLELLTVRRRSQ
jgi:GNAT superfamily N-acetyltransferase